MYGAWEMKYVMIMVCTSWSVRDHEKLPVWRGIKQCKCMVHFEGFPLNSALFGLVI